MDDHISRAPWAYIKIGKGVRLVDRECARMRLPGDETPLL